MIPFTYNGQRYTVAMICSYGPALSRSDVGATDYQITGRDFSKRFSTEFPLPKPSIERAALAAYKRTRHNEFRQWARNNGFSCVGAALSFAHS